MSDEERSPKEEARERTRDRKRDQGSALMNNGSVKVWHALDALLIARLTGEAPTPPRGAKKGKKGKKGKTGKKGGAAPRR